jgi:hypothetical protein
MKTLRASSLTLFTVMAFSAVAVASFQPVLDLTGGGFATEPLSPSVAGWEFHLDQPLTIGGVGIWDEHNQPLNIAHEVGLYTSGQTLLLDILLDNNNTTAVASASPDGQWLFTSISPLVLQPGDYVLAATWGDPIDNADPFRLQANGVESFLNYTGMCSKTQLPSLQLVFPDCSGAPLSSASFFGPNLAVVPEPGSIVMFGAAMLGLGSILRRKF